MARYFILGNIPFSEVEQEEFIEMLTYGRPQLRSKLIGATQMKKKVTGVMEEAETWLVKYISVSNLFYLARIIDDIPNILQESVPGKIAFATDAWTSSNGHAFQSLVASWIHG